jgi:hypothetical protein
VTQSILQSDLEHTDKPLPANHRVPQILINVSADAIATNAPLHRGIGQFPPTPDKRTYRKLALIVRLGVRAQPVDATPSNPVI